MPLLPLEKEISKEGVGGSSRKRKADPVPGACRKEITAAFPTLSDHPHARVLPEIYGVLPSARLHAKP